MGHELEAVAHERMRGTMLNRNVWILSLCAAALGGMAWGQPAEQILPKRGLVNPASPAEASRLTLPAKRPTILQANYWRAARPQDPSSNEQSNHTAPDAAEAQQNVPDPAPLELPSWLKPQALAADSIEPNEPPGEAVFVEDDPEQSPADVIKLAIANVERTPSRAAALLVVARELAVEAKSMGDYSDVIHQCHRALDAGADPQTATSLAGLGAWAYNRRGEIRLDMGEEHAAFEDFQEAILLDGDCWPALHNRGVTLARYGKHAEALADFDRVVVLAPDFSVARNNRAEAFSQLKQWRKAIDDYTAVLEVLPDEPAIYNARAYAHHQLGDTPAAVTDYNQAIRLDDSLADAYVGRGSLYAAENMYEQAAADLQRALQLDPRSIGAYRSTAWLLSTCPLSEFRSGEKAIEAAERLAQLLGKEEPIVLDTLAVAHAGAGNFARAITYQQQAIVLADDTDRKSQYAERLSLYRKGKPFRAE